MKNIVHVVQVYVYVLCIFAQKRGKGLSILPSRSPRHGGNGEGGGMEGRFPSTPLLPTPTPYTQEKKVAKVASYLYGG